MLKKIRPIILSLLVTPLMAQPTHEKGFELLKSMLNGQQALHFQKAVFEVENIYWDNALKEADWDNSLQLLSSMAQAHAKNAPSKAYNGKDSILIQKYAALFKTLTDTSILVTASGDTAYFMPLKYDFEDMFGQKDWSNMFVTKLLATHKGNCHSMPYLYKILCDKWGIPCHLALAPNHIYIKHRSEKVGWYNTELTSASFPIDAWIMASGYIPLEAIQNGIYMEALDDKKSITLCVYDLAKGYDRKYPDNDGHFIIKCCDLALEYFPNFINILILKAETKKRQFEHLAKERNISRSELKQQKDGKSLWGDMTQLYNRIHQLGYRAMPEKMYVDWITSLAKERKKYHNASLFESPLPQSNKQD